MDNSQPLRRYTFVTIGFEEDGGLLHLQARSMRLYCPLELIDEIIVVDNSQHVQSKWLAGLLEQYGKLASRVRVIRAHEIVDIPADTHGWFSQQIIKIKVADVVHSDRYVILDAKNHLISHLDREFLETPAGKPRTNGYSYIGHPMQRFLEQTAEYLGIDYEESAKWFTRTTTPFTVVTNEARELVGYIETREGRSFSSAFLERGLCEFFLYSGYLVAKGVLRETYDLTQPYEPQIWPEKTSAAECAQAIRKAIESNCHFMAVHRKALANMDIEAQRVMSRFWHGRGLFASVGNGVRFCRDPQRSRQNCDGRVVSWPISHIVSFFGFR